MERILVFLFFWFVFPPFGGVMMTIGCSSRDLSTADYALGFVLPFYGHYMFWTCP